MLKRIFIFFCLILFSIKTLAEQAVLIWCLGHLPNRTVYQANTEPRGIEVDLMRDLAARLNMRLEYTVPTPINRCLQQLERGQVDVVAGLLFSKERDRLFLLIPYDSARPESWFVHKANPIENKTKLRITLIEGRLYSANLRERYQEKGHQLKSVASMDDALAMLYFQQTDVVIGPEHVTLGYIVANPRYRETLVLAPQDYQPNFEAHIAISRTGRYAEHHQAFQQALQAIRAEGRYQFYD
ncbi:substrate-binding periplasmic protein [Alkalimonas amylolytica]|uniref:ABC-type amino acid transport substrate-binding protein n=1 Tax=Alkalimonas amylolytica TaxID=152573 RepID=A0A1H4FPN6_ALKAM|nr:transporter substrate-binding domain-containing protein [Alkalimonas amylolytica]SEA99111.1 ABC-type amino acid transport substrate-binding protein [Alkalimonas amylolytica]